MTQLGVTLEADLTVDKTPRCRICGTQLARTFLDLGDMPLANSYLASPADPDPRFPLRARVCERCLLVQADPIVSPADIFSEYPFFSSMSAPWIEHCRRYVAEVTDRFGLDDHSQIIEIASNDGCLLEQFDGPKVLGVDPARNVTDIATVPTVTQFFSLELAHDLPRADLVIANNVLGHVPDLDDFIGGLSVLLKRDGVLTIEVPWLVQLVEDCQFDTIYHEHFSYFSLRALEGILNAHGLQVFDVARLAVHGGSLRVFAARDRRRPSVEVMRVRYAEEARGVWNAATRFYRGFADDVRAHVRNLCQWFGEQNAARRIVAGAGAPAKANTLLNAARTTAHDIHFVTDVSPHKQGRFLPGSHIPVLSPQAMYELEPDVVLVLAWNWYDEVVRSFPDLDAEFVHPLHLT